MRSSRSLWVLIALAASISFESTEAQESSSELSSLPESPPLVQTIAYVGKTTTTDFRGPGMGQHLQFFPAFGLSAATTGLRTDCDACIEFTPDFENFKHHLPADPIGRTFSPDAGGFGNEGEEGYVPSGVKTAGGNPNWDVFTLPDGSTGVSGTTYDTHACGNANNTVNQIRINTGSLRDFCLNVITDNTNGTHDPSIRIEARSDEVDRSLESHADLSFDGETDMYTFRYMGMQEGDRIKIRVKGDGDEATCAGVGLGGIMVSHISTCIPPPGTCIPNCEGRACGDDGCGGSCGACPRADNLSRITGVVDVTVMDTASPLSYSEADVEAPVEVGASLSSVLDEIETLFSTTFHEELVQTADDAEVSLDVRDYRLFLMPRTIGIELTAMDVPNEGRFEMVFTLGGFHQHAKFKPEDDIYTAGSLNPNARVDVVATTLAASGTYDPQTGEIKGPYDAELDVFGQDPLASVADVSVTVETSSDWDNLVDIAQFFELDAPSRDLLARQFESALGEALLERLGPVAGQELSGLLRPAVELVPEKVEIDGVDHAPQIRSALLDPAPGLVISILFDATRQMISGANPIETAILSTLSVSIGNEFAMVSRVLQTTFPPIVGNIESTSLDLYGNFIVEGWTCGIALERSLDVGLFADGVALRVELADGDSEPDIAATCGTDGTLNQYRYLLTATPEDLGCVNAWDNRLSVIAGDDGFERDLGDVHRAAAGQWLVSPFGPGAYPFPSANERQFVADFDADGRDDYIWDDNGWWVALSSGAGLDPPALWLSKDLPGVGPTQPSSPARQFVADFDGDGRSDYAWENYGWWVARSNGNGFDTPLLWLANNLPGIGWTFPPNNSERQFVTDLDGDGASDYLWEYNGWWGALSNGGGFDVAATPWLPNHVPGIGWTFPSSPSRQFVADLDGDGRSDYLWENNGWYAALSNGAGFDAPTLWMTASQPGVGWTFPPDAPARQFVADMNGDGRNDYLWENDGWWVALSNGTGFDPPTLWMAAGLPGVGYAFPPDAPARQFVADFDGDGRTDYFWEYGGWWVALSNGTGFDTPKRWLRDGANGVESPFPNNAPSRQFVADFSGDGFPEYMWEAAGWHVSSTLLHPLACESLDGDNDGVLNSVDNCPLTANSGQIDVDGDGLGDACDDACADGIDNDGDGRVDHPSDGGCQSFDSAAENPACSDGIDNDGDGLIDFDGDLGATDPDPACGGFEYGTSEAVPEPGFGLGLSFGCLLLIGLRRRL